MDMIPVRCFSCGKVVDSLWEPFIKLLKDGYTEKEALDYLKIDRYCCRRMIISQPTNN